MKLQPSNPGTRLSFIEGVIEYKLFRPSCIW
jgi:hypothetical protein